MKNLYLVIALVLVIGLTGCAKSTTGTQTFTITQFAQYNGQNGNKVYDVTNIQAWQNGMHHGLQACVDMSVAINQSPLGKSILNNLTVVGTLKYPIYIPIF